MAIARKRTTTKPRRTLKASKTSRTRKTPIRVKSVSKTRKTTLKTKRATTARKTLQVKRVAIARKKLQVKRTAATRKMLQVKRAAAARKTLQVKRAAIARKKLQVKRATAARKTLQVKRATAARKTLQVKRATTVRKTLKSRGISGTRKTLNAKRVSNSRRAHFEGDIKTVWIQAKSKSNKGIKMKLIDDFIFVDKSGTKWTAPKGRIVDGKSIPEQLRSEYLGTSFAGGYGRALMIYDVACQERKKSPQKVHKMFYDAMIIDGVPKAKAEFMYHALLNDGPRWKISQRSRVRR